MAATHFDETLFNLDVAKEKVAHMLDILHKQGRQFQVRTVLQVE